MTQPTTHDTELSRRVTLNRNQFLYLLALLETRTARRPMSRSETPDEATERAVGAMRRLQEAEDRLSALYHADEGWTGVDHLLDYLGEVLAESDVHELWERTV